MLDLGTARGAITLDANEFLSGVGIVKSGVEDLGGIGETAGRGLASLSDRIDNVIDSMGRFSGVARVIDGVSRALGALAITGGVTLIAGGARAAWDQVRAVQNATSALRAYEKDADKVDKVLKGLLDYARSDLGVLFSRQELFAAAQGLKLYGAETANLVRYVEIMSRSVGLGMSNWDQLGTVIGRVGSTGRLVGQDFDYLTAAGFRLDDSLRNANLTWDQLFDALDRGIPANALEGVAQNIDGLVIRVRSAIRDIGNAFLGVDRDTSQFIEGGLGWYLVEGLKEAPGAIRRVTDAAADLGGAIATGIGYARDFVAAYQSLPGPVRELVEWILKLATAYGALRVAASAMSMVVNVAGMTGLIGNVRNLTGAFTAAGGGAMGFRAALSGLLASINPVGLAVAAVGIGLGALAVMWGNQQREIKATEQALDAMRDSYLDLTIARNEARIAGDFETDRQLQQLQTQISYITQMSQEVDKLYSTGFWFGTAQTPGQMAAIREQYKLTADEIVRLTAAQEALGAAFQDSRIDGMALSAELQNIYDEWSRGLITGSEAVVMIEDLSQNYSRFAIQAEDATEAVEALSVGLDGLTESQRSFNLEMAQMRIDGDWAMADTLTQLNDLFGENSRASSEAAEYIEFFSSNVAAGNIDLDDYAGRIQTLNFLYDQGLLPQHAYDAAIVAITMHAAEAATTTRTWEDAIRDGLIQGTEAATIAMEELNEAIADNMQALLEVAGLDDPLSQWNLSGNATAMSLLAMNAQQAAAALENTFRVVVGNTNAFASQAQGVEDWISSLATAEEGLTKLDELLQNNLITQTEYNAAMQAHADISAANASVQENVLAIQAQQAPIIADQTRALADYIENISSLPAHQQRAALGWMDAATAGQAFELQALAIAAATGQMGAAGMDMAGTMIASLAMVDPYLAAVLEDMGLISMGADGTITIHWSGLQEGMSDFDRLSVMFLEFMNLVSDEPITFEMLGLEDPREKLKDIEDTTIRLGDTPVSIPVGIEEEGGPGGVEASFDTLIDGITNNISPVIIPVELRMPSSAASAGQSAGAAARGALDGLAADFTFTVSADTSAADSRLERVNSALDTLRDSETSVSIDADATQADAVLDNLQVRLFGYDGLISTTTLNADATQANAELDTLAERLSGYRNAVSTTTLEADDDQANKALDDLAQRLSGYRNLVSTTTLDANPASANVVLDLLGQRLSGYRNAVSTTTLDADSSSAHEVIRLLENRLREVDGSQAVVYLYAIDFATSTINSVSRDLTNLNGRTSTVYVDTVARGGGIVGRAGGGIVREPVTLVGEDGPELVALPYGSEVFSNSATMRMLREASSRAPEPVAAPQRSTSGTTVIDNSTHTETYVALNDEQFAELLAAKDKANIVHDAMTNRHSASQFRKVGV